MAFGAVIGQTFTGGVKNNRLVIGTSTAGWLQADCDYLCDGTNDEQEFNTAIQFLNTYDGGEIVVLDGAYNISAAIAISIPNVILIGNGNATILKNLSTTTNLINVAASDFHIANMSLKGTTQKSCINISSAGSNVVVESVAFSGADNGIYTEGSSGQFIGNQFVSNKFGMVIGGNNCIVNGNNFANNGHGIEIENSNNIISNNNITNGTVGIYCELDCSNINIVGNNITGASSYSMQLENLNESIIGNNVCQNNNTGIYLSSCDDCAITGNTCLNNTNYGIHLVGSNGNTVSGNICKNNNSSTLNNNGIYLVVSSSNNTVTGNTCSNNNYGIDIYNNSNNNTITGNTCNNNNTGIYLSVANNNAVSGNTCIRGTGTSSDYSASQFTIQLLGTSNNLVVGNNIMGKNYSDSGGSNNTFANNKYN